MKDVLSDPPGRKFTPLVQGTLIRAYKIMGLVALTGILVGLICFLTVNVFYLVNRSWVRPVVLSPTHTSVLNAMSALSDEMADRDALISEREQLHAELVGIDRILDLNAKLHEEFSGAFEGQPDDLRGQRAFEALLARRAYSEAIVERERSAARRTVIENHIKRLDTAIERYDQLIESMQSSAYIEATENQVTVAFVPYENLDSVGRGETIYACRWGLVLCRAVGKIGDKLNGEVTDQHPQSGNSMRGVMVEIRLDDQDATEERALFVGKRPFWIL